MCANLVAIANDLGTTDISWSDGPGYLAGFLVVLVGLGMLAMTPASSTCHDGQPKSGCGKCK